VKLRFLFFYINPETNSSGYYRLENSKEGIKIAVEGYHSGRELYAEKNLREKR
jgi:hypothetical protein